jgi:hypothetical protein
MLAGLVSEPPADTQKTEDSKVGFEEGVSLDAKREWKTRSSGY